MRPESPHSCFFDFYTVGRRGLPCSSLPLHRHHLFGFRPKLKHPMTPQHLSSWYNQLACSFPGGLSACTWLSCGIFFSLAEESMDRMDRASMEAVMFGRQSLPSKFRQMSPFV